MLLFLEVKFLDGFLWTHQPETILICPHVWYCHARIQNKITIFFLKGLILDMGKEKENMRTTLPSEVEETVSQSLEDRAVTLLTQGEEISLS